MFRPDLELIIFDTFSPEESLIKCRAFNVAQRSLKLVLAGNSADKTFFSLLKKSVPRVQLQRWVVNGFFLTSSTASQALLSSLFLFLLLLSH